MRFPDMTALARRKRLTVNQFTAAFARANPSLKPDMLRVKTTRGNRLSEVWLCMDKAMEFARCHRRQSASNAASLLHIEPGPAMLSPKDPTRRQPRKPRLSLDLEPHATARKD